MRTYTLEEVMGMRKDNKLLFGAFDKRWLDVNSEFAKGEFGSISWNVEVKKDSYDKQAKKEKRNAFNVSGDVRLTDCFKVISLSLYADNFSELDARIAKIDEMLTSLTLLRQNLDACKAAAVDWNNAPFQEEEANDDKD